MTLLYFVDIFRHTNELGVLISEKNELCATSSSTNLELTYHLSRTSPLLFQKCLLRSHLQLQVATDWSVVL